MKRASVRFVPLFCAAALAGALWALWERSRLFLSTLSDDEILSHSLSGFNLLTRLFHEDGAWAYAPRPLKAICRCSRQRIAEVLSTIEMEELREMLENGAVSVNCRFCNTTERFTEEMLEKLHNINWLGD